MLHWKIIVSHLKSIPIHSQMLISSCKLATQSSKLKMYPGNDSDCTIRIVSKHLLSFFPVVYHASIHNGGHDLLNCMLGPIWACSLPELHICWFPNMLWTMITFYLHCSAHFIANYYIITFFYLKACQSFIKWPCSSCFLWTMYVAGGFLIMGKKMLLVSCRSLTVLLKYVVMSSRLVKQLLHAGNLHRVLSLYC